MQLVVAQFYTDKSAPTIVIHWSFCQNAILLNNYYGLNI